MGIGGHFRGRVNPADAELLMGYTGKTYFADFGWNWCNQPEWVLDYINSGRQQQRLSGRGVFIRPSGLAALYRPGTWYGEYRRPGNYVDESYIIFRLDGELETTFHRITAPRGWVHVRDPESSLERVLRRTGELLFYRRPGHRTEVTGLFWEILGQIESTIAVRPQLRQVRRGGMLHSREDMASVVERYVREHIDEPVTVKELARQVGLGLSSFAHRYPAACGETPYQTVLRLKIEAAKRLLLWEGMSVKQAAVRLGFSSPFHLSRVFKLQEGSSPTAWVASLKEKGEPSEIT